MGCRSKIAAVSAQKVLKENLLILHWFETHSYILIHHLFDIIQIFNITYWVGCWSISLLAGSFKRSLSGPETPTGPTRGGKWFNMDEGSKGLQSWSNPGRKCCSTICTHWTESEPPPPKPFHLQHIHIHSASASRFLRLLLSLCSDNSLYLMTLNYIAK